MHKLDCVLGSQDDWAGSSGGSDGRRECHADVPISRPCPLEPLVIGRQRYIRLARSALEALARGAFGISRLSGVIPSSSSRDLTDGRSTGRHLSCGAFRAD